MKMATFEEVVKKHYKTQEERIRKLEQHKDFICEFAIQTNVLRSELQGKRKISIWIFELDDKADPPVIYMGAQKCCFDESSTVVTDEDRKYIETEIAKLTRFQKIVWEL